MSRRFFLPSGRRVGIDVRGEEPDGGGSHIDRTVRALAEGRIVVTEGAAEVAWEELALADFHTVRAIATGLGALREEQVAIGCRNCDAELATRPCAALELGPFVDGELDDEELDRTLDLSVAHEIPRVRVGGRVAQTVRLDARTVRDVLPLFRFIRRRTFRVGPAFVRALGVVALGDETDPLRIARSLSGADDEAFGAVTDLFLAAHYPPRLFAIAHCAQCGARNDVDAPYDREFEPSGPAADDAPSTEQGPVSKRTVFPEFSRFDAAAAEIAEEEFGRFSTQLNLVVDAGVPACDDGGEPLLGSYLPPFAGDTTLPSRPAEITVYYRTFRAMGDEDGPYDWETELRETVVHELEHHIGYLRGDDPLDDEEHAEIAREARRVLGVRALGRQLLSSFAAEFLGFLRMTWPLWALLVAAVLAFGLLGR